MRASPPLSPTVRDSPSYTFTALGIYINYIVHGMGVIAIMQNMTALMAQYGTDEAGIAGVVSGMGMGRVVSYFFMGDLSDRFGRKPVLLAGIALYVIFFIGVLYSPSTWVAFSFAVLGGVSNACLDAGSYPPLMEAFPRSAGTAMIGCKAAMALGQMTYPLFVGWLLLSHMRADWAFFLPTLLLLANLAVVLRSPFPPVNADPLPEDARAMPKLRAKTSKWEMALVLMLGFLVYATFHTVLIWMPRVTQVVVQEAEAPALRTITYYSIGALVGVLVSGTLAKRLVRPVLIVSVFPGVAGLAALYAYLFPSAVVCNWVSFLVGLCAAGGLLQLGLSVMNEFFPHSKARLTSYYMLFGSAANFLVPLVTGKLFMISAAYVLLFDAVLGFASTATGIILMVRYYRSFVVPGADVRLFERRFARIEPDDAPECAPEEGLRQAPAQE